MLEHAGTLVGTRNGVKRKGGPAALSEAGVGTTRAPCSPAQDESLPAIPLASLRVRLGDASATLPAGTGRGSLHTHGVVAHIGNDADSRLGECQRPLHQPDPHFTLRGMVPENVCPAIPVVVGGSHDVLLVIGNGAHLAFRLHHRPVHGPEPDLAACPVMPEQVGPAIAGVVGNPGDPVPGVRHPPNERSILRFRTLFS